MIWNILTHPLVAFQTLTIAHSLRNRTFQVWSETFNCCHIFLFVTANWDPSGVLWISYSKIKKKIDVFMGRFTQEHDMECSKQSTGCIWIVLKVMTHNDPSDVLKIANLRLMPWFFFLFPFFARFAQNVTRPQKFQDEMIFLNRDIPIFTLSREPWQVFLLHSRKANSLLEF